MRNEMIGAVVRRAVEHPEFRRRLIDDPRDALRTHGFAFDDADMAEVDAIRKELGSAEDVETRLDSIAEKYGIKTK